MQSFQRRPGGTLIESVVTLALFVVLVAVLLPAVQAIRAAAARLQCQNNLRQLALATLTAHDADGRLPAGTRPTAAGEPYPMLNWHVAVLPYLEQEPLAAVVLADRRRAGQPYPAVRAGQDVVVPAFGCPADGRTGVAWKLPLYGPDFRIALTSYLGNAGTDYRRRDGALFLGSRVNLLGVTDGTSNTLLAGERPPSADVRYGWWHHGVGQRWTGSLDATLGAREVNRVTGQSPYAACPPGPHRFRPGRVDDHCAAFHFWSLHPGGANFAFCDGSVRFLPYAADAVLPALATRAGGEVAAPD